MSSSVSLCLSQLCFRPGWRSHLCEIKGFKEWRDQFHLKLFFFFLRLRVALYLL